jgi:hypothetical protein
VTGDGPRARIRGVLEVTNLGVLPVELLTLSDPASAAMVGTNSAVWAPVGVPVRVPVSVILPCAELRSIAVPGTAATGPSTPGPVRWGTVRTADGRSHPLTSALSGGYGPWTAGVDQACPGSERA